MGMKTKDIKVMTMHRARRASFWMRRWDEKLRGKVPDQLEGPLLQRCFMPFALPGRLLRRLNITSFVGHFRNAEIRRERLESIRQILTKDIMVSRKNNGF
jgi:hypothetical protein